MRNIELYISKGQNIIASVKVSQGDVLQKIKSIDMSHGFPKGMTIAKKVNLFYTQYDVDYSVNGNGSHITKADKYKLNLYFNPEKQNSDMCDIQHAAMEQAEMVENLISAEEAITDRDDVCKRFNLQKLTFSKQGDKIVSYEQDQQKQDDVLLTAGFFASKTIGLDFDPLQAKENYGMRDEQEKAFALQKGPLGQDRLRTWSEASKLGRMFVCFVGLILASYVHSVWEKDETLQKKFDSTEFVLAEMRTIRCIEHEGKLKFITPFVGAQVEICKAFGFDIPDGCAPIYVSKAKPSSRKRGRPAKPKTEHLD